MGRRIVASVSVAWLPSETSFDTDASKPHAIADPSAHDPTLGSALVEEVALYVWTTHVSNMLALAVAHIRVYSVALMVLTEREDPRLCRCMGHGSG